MSTNNEFALPTINCQNSTVRMEKREIKMIKFLVRGEVYEISDVKIEEFPLKDSYINLLYRRYLDKEGSFSGTVKTKDGAICIEVPDKNFVNFDKVVQIYEMYPRIPNFSGVSTDRFYPYEIFVEKDHQFYGWDKMGRNTFDPKMELPKFLNAEYYNNFITELNFYGLDNHVDPNWRENDGDKDDDKDDDNYIKEIDLIQITKRREELKAQGKLDWNFDLAALEEYNKYEKAIRAMAEKMYGSYNEIISRVYRQMSDLLCFEHYRYGKISRIMEVMRTIGGHISGSFMLDVVTRSSMDQGWGSNDIDIYVNKSMFEGMIGKVSGARIKSVFKPSLPETIAEFVRHLFDCKEIEIHVFDESTQPLQPSELITTNSNGNSSIRIVRKNREMDNGYGVCKFLSYVIKFKVGRRETPIDIIVVDCSVPYFIESFDFDFNKIYYDGINLHVYDWISIILRRSPNRYMPDRNTFTQTQKYFMNFKRIQKYFCRGFTVTYN